MPLTELEVHALRGLGDSLELREVAEVYLPVSRLISLYHEAYKRLHNDTMAFLGQQGAKKVPFIIGVAGSVAVGKSTTARLLQSLLSRWSNSPRVDLVTTDGFLYPNAELERRGIMARKGFPESYDRRVRCSTSSHASRQAKSESLLLSIHTSPTTSSTMPRSS